MKKTIILILFLMVSVTVLFAVGCSDGYGKYSGDISDARAEVANAKDKLFSEPNSAITYSYMVHSVVNKEEYDLGQRNIFKFNTNPETGLTDINRFNYYYGSANTVSDTYYYKDGALYTEMYNALYKDNMTKEEFMSYTDGTRYAVDRDFFDLSVFSDVTAKKSESKTYIKFTEDNGEFSKKIANFLGFDTTEYTYKFDNIEYVAEIDEKGYLLKESLMFTAEYSYVNAPERKIVYDGEFYCEAEEIGGVKLNEPILTNGFTETDDIKVLDSFADKAFGVLSTYTTLDADYNRYIKIGDDTTEYTVRNYVHFTEAYRNEKYTYGSMDRRFYRTPKEINTMESGIFIDDNGYHYRTTDGEPSDFEENPYSDIEMIAMVFETLSGERPPSSDICDVKVEITDEYITYTFKYTQSASFYYAQYLLEYFAEDGQEVSLDGTKMSVKENQSVIKVRRSDGCVVSHELVYSAVFADKITVETTFKMNVKATGDDVTVLTLSDWEKEQEAAK